MTAACREACCNVTARLNVGELFERGFRRNRAAPLAIEGSERSDAEGNCARFSLESADGKLIAIGFNATTCATLIAYCELIAELTPGFTIEIARQLTARDLIDGLPGVPVLKQGRAALAIEAFQAALAAADARPQPAKGENPNEGRVHLRHPAP
jgi:NifU-like protein involved in Fe-S cluster formation